MKEAALHFGKQYRIKRMVTFLENVIIFDVRNLLPMDEKHMGQNIFNLEKPNILKALSVQNMS